MLTKQALEYYQRLDPHLREVMNGTAVAFGLKLLAAGVRLLFGVILARLLGAEGAGVYFQAILIITISEVVARFGLGDALLKFVATNVDDWPVITGVYHKGAGLLLLTSIPTVVFVWAMAPWLAILLAEPGLVAPLRVLALAIIPLSFRTLYSELLRALKRIAAAQIVREVGLPALSLVGVWWLAPVMGVMGVTVAYVVAATGVALLGLRLWQMVISPHRTGSGHFAMRPLVSSGFAVLGVRFVDVLLGQISLFLLGVWGSSHEVGIFGAATRAALLTTFILTSVNSIVAPKFSFLYHQNEMLALTRVIRHTTRLSAVLGLPISLTFFLFPEWIMQIFGPDFTQGAASLMILVAGEYVGVACGSIVFLLLMTGHEKVARNNALFSLAINISLCTMLIPQYGLKGAAIATAVSVALKNLTAVYLVRKHLGINTLTAFYKW